MGVQSLQDVSSATSAADVVEGDLEYICDALAEELRSLAGKRVLITGGAGFLGYYFVQSLLHANRTRTRRNLIKVVVLDSFQRGMPDWLAAWEEDGALSTLAQDVTLPLDDEAGAFDYVVHAASIASPIFYRLHPIATMNANVEGLRSLLDRCRAQQQSGHAISGFLFMSSSEIYGDPPPEWIPTPEAYRGNVSCTGPRACYDESKRYGETLCVNYAREYGMPVTVARPFNNYGPGLKITDGRALPDFARDVLAGRDIRMLSDGSPRRTFCYVADAIVGYYKTLVRGKPGESYNIGVDGPEISVRDLAERVVTLARDRFSYHGHIVFDKSKDAHYLTDNPNRRCPSIDKARGDLDYQPGIGIDAGLLRSLLWYADHREAEEA